MNGVYLEKNLWGQAINLLTFFIPLLVPPYGGIDVYLEKNSFAVSFKRYSFRRSGQHPALAYSGILIE